MGSSSTKPLDQKPRLTIFEPQLIGVIVPMRSAPPSPNQTQTCPRYYYIQRPTVPPPAPPKFIKPTRLAPPPPEVIKPTRSAPLPPPIIQKKNLVIHYVPHNTKRPTDPPPPIPSVENENNVMNQSNPKRSLYIPRPTVPPPPPPVQVSILPIPAVVKLRAQARVRRSSSTVSREVHPAVGTDNRHSFSVARPSPPSAIVSNICTCSICSIRPNEHRNSFDPSMNEEYRTLKCCLVGEEAVGKTSLIVSYTRNGFVDKYQPTAFDNYSVVVKVDKKPVRVQLCDTAGQSNLDSIRPLSYPDCDVFIIVYSVVNPISFQKIIDRWVPEINKANSHTPVVLVGTQMDRRWSAPVQHTISTAKGKNLANQIKAIDFFECSALTQGNVKLMFDAAIVAGMDGRRTAIKKSRFRQGIQRFVNITKKVF